LIVLEPTIVVFGQLIARDETGAQMSVCSDIADYKWLTGSEAAAYLAELGGSAEPLHISIERLRRGLSPAKAHLLLEQVELRRRAREKFTLADRMFFTRVGLEQATDEWVARYKAARFIAERAGSCDEAGTSERAGSSATPAIADLCCGIGGDLIALLAHSTVIGVDRDPIVTHFAEVNASLFNAADCVAIATGRVEDFELNAAAAHIDPDRRATGRRITSLEFCQPSLDTMERLLSQLPQCAVKLAPATNVPHEWADRCELEWISRDGECRQLVAWHGELARSPGLRRATILRTSAASRAAGTLAQRGSGPVAVERTICGGPDYPVCVSNKLGDFIFDIDPAIRAARLQGALAEEFNLSAIAPGPSYFTGDSAITDAAVSCFKIEDVLPLRVREIAQHLRQRGIGRLEIKKRGLEIDPEKLRRELKPRGDNSATLLITPIAGRSTAIIAQRIQ
jgi:THUMP domain-like